MSARDQPNGWSLTQEAADWFARLRSESVSEVEEARFRAWLAGDPARRREFDEISALWDTLDSVAESPEVLSEQQRLSSRSTAPRFSRRAIVGWALVAGGACAAGLLAWQRLALDIYATGIGEQRTVPLSDGSIVTLNTSSKIAVRYSAAQRRVEILQGQANFEVARDVHRPFIVSAGKGEIAALGTEFDVYQRASGTVVTLIRGRLAVVPEVPWGRSGASAALIARGSPGNAAQAALHAIVLTPGEQLSFGVRGRAPVKTRVDLERVLAWRNRKMIFEDTPLSEVIAEANRYSRVKIELRAPELASAPISGVFDAGRNEALAQGLKVYLGLTIERPDDQRIIMTHPAR